MHSQSTLMIVHAHPDDEVIGTGGTLARYARQHVRTVLVTATLGEEGEIVVKDMDTPENHARLATIRREELRRATELLGIAHQEFLGYRDSGMAGRPSNEHPACFHQADPDEAAGRLVRLVRAYQPQVLISYNAHGGYGHPDHIACYHATQAAFEAAADPARFPEAGPAWAVSKLYEINRPRELTRQAWERMRERGMKTPLDNPDYQLENFTAPDELITTAIDVAEFMGLKRAALLEHRTQIAADGPFLSMPEDIGRSWFGVEYFTLLRARVALPPHDGYEDDLFAGIG
ncbi:MAG TPA: N-acetyl-1-D-myo-inositol-2-amino-2-deoxy-alpha-D-glucopyranoside deacetylase [Kouleothrix sp.]|uniref:N-acetyl-1-D-myo-inositol-2-amino-2-deoxy-alpha- D-glucopyranoside deacetylase n=1 Tax=Kouleothrix sp. TaxID=2779161 RepID=UPI002BBFD86A|nr:N-acetyl-1-D-myo-inositol-2-amino-2-deoxy-alpha-D-glucopyranoside deacetylase [Kouleothrix sp.]HRC76194.1 N-acetyl-1-D-myo-inositol-2-amino-2-deoxy-alpha-D-glucopyranoside deacetylase [Kouleothrix sp.]